MLTPGRIVRRLRQLVRRRRAEADMTEEMRFHLEQRAADYVEDGLQEKEASFAAQRRFGNLASIQEHARAAQRWAWIEQGVRDVRFTFRQFRRSPAFTATAIATLALCIGATTAIFSALYALVLKPPPFDEPDRLVELYHSAKKTGITKLPGSVGIYHDYRANAASFETLALWRVGWPVYGEDGSLERVWGARATADIFSLLRVDPVLGGFFTAEQNRPGADDVVVLTESFWESRFGRDPAIIGQTIRIDRQPMTVVGVVERAMESFDPRVQFIRALSWPPEGELPLSRYVLGPLLFARLADGVTVEQADAEINGIEQRYVESAPVQVRQVLEEAGSRMNASAYQTERAKPVATALYLLQAGVAFVLVIGCVNVANLLLARTSARRSELAIRVALGAGRQGIARQLLTECLVLTGVGASLGVAFAWVGVRAINRYTSEVVPQALPVTLDRDVLGFAVALTLIVAVGIGLIPLLHVLRANLLGPIQTRSRGASTGRGVHAFSSLLVVGQLAVALVLLTGAGLLIVAFQKAISVDPGVDVHGVVAATINVPSEHRGTDAMGEAFRDRLEQALREVPGVTAVTMSFNIPLGSGGVMAVAPLTLADDTRPPGSPGLSAYVIAATPGYLDTMRLPLVAGRFFEPQDAPFARQRFVVDESFARKYFPHRSAVGGRFSFEGQVNGEDAWYTIIGVVKDVPHNGVDDRSGIPFVYRYFAGHPVTFGIFVRTGRPMAEAMAMLRDKIHSVDPAIAVDNVTTLESAIHDSFAPRRAIMLLLTSFAALALFLAVLGIYGVLAYDVSQRTREIGIRSTVGATRRQVVGLILKQGCWRAGLGLVIGLGAAWLLSRYMTSLLFEVQPTDPAVYAAVSVVLFTVALVASYLPARHAAKIDPLIALRTE